MEFTVYILQSQQDGSFYIGYTTDLHRRLSEHNSGESGYTSGKMPWKVVYSEKCETKTAVIKREKFLKNQRNRAFYEKLIRNYKLQ
jgi:putative endonuclease